MTSIFYNGKFYTQDPLRPFCQAIAVSDGIIQASGTNEEIFASSSVNSQRFNLNGSVVLPGFTDSHIHLLQYAQNLVKVDCETSWKKECLERVRIAVQGKRPGEWVLGHGWNHHYWQDGIGNAGELDDIAPNNPVFLTNKSLHGAWVNHYTLQLAGIDNDTADPEGGLIGRDENGIANGLLYEYAVNLVEKLIPEQTINENMAAILTAQNQLFSYGITSVHDFDRTPAFRALQNLDIECQLKLRVLKSIPQEKLDAAISAGIQTGFGSDHLRMGSLKLFMDGALGTKTAAMLLPYENSTESGMMLLSQDELLEIGKKAAGGGISLAIHAIGDRANHVVAETLSILNKMECRQGRKMLRHRVEHVQCIQPEDLGTFKIAGIIASMQPIHLCSDIPAAARNWGDRSANTYTFSSVLQQRIPLVFGSDAPVEVPDCIVGIHAAINRQQRDFLPSSGWYPQEKITVEQAVRAFTTTPHWLAGDSGQLGLISPNYRCDLTILDQDIFAMPTDQVLHVNVIGTVIDGEWVYQK